MNKTYDFVVLGAGNAGMAAAKTAFDAGKSVAIVEHQEFGGTCPNRGCTPKKVFVAAAKALDNIRKASKHQIAVTGAELDWPALVNRKQDLISFIPGAMKSAATNRADVYVGEAKFHDANTIEVDGTLLKAAHIVIATGSKPRPLALPGSDFMVTSDELLGLEQVPDSVVFVGGGVIALEFSHVLARAGARVTVLEALPDLLPRMDQDAVAVLKQASEAIGIRFETGVKVQAISQHGDVFNVAYEREGRQTNLPAKLVVNGAGRIPNIEDLELSAGGIEVERGAIKTEDGFRSATNPRVYLAGDVVAVTPQLSPLATIEGAEIVSRILDPDSATKKSGVIPQVVYSIPTLASVGLTEVEARAQYSSIKSHVSDISSWLSAKTAGEDFAWAKILRDEDTDRIVGAHMVGHQGEELIHLFALAMNHGITASALKQTTFAFPTFSSDIKNLW